MGLAVTSRVCVCVRTHACACVHMHVCACVCAHVKEKPVCRNKVAGLGSEGVLGSELIEVRLKTGPVFNIMLRGWTG